MWRRVGTFALLLAGWCVMGGASPAPEKPTAEAGAPSVERAACVASEARQFDFWIGEWAVSWEGGGGRNRVRSILEGCVVEEDFEGKGGPAGEGLRGLSVSAYNRQTGKWQQTWVDNQGGYLGFTGEFSGGRMVLSREASRDGARFVQRMVWHGISRDSLEWNWERSDDGGKTWRLLWLIHYARQGS